MSQWDASVASTALWNTVDERVQAAIAANGSEIDFGDGSDGSFDDGPTQTGVTVSGNTITIDTDVKAEFDFTSFSLSNGKTIRATGSAPLVIRVLGPTTIAGVIDLGGQDGTANSLASSSSGGAPGAGGRAGGSGGIGVSSTAGTAGLPSTGNARGGGLGSTTTSENGGGGGCIGNDGVPAEDAAAGKSNGVVGAAGSGAAGACPGGTTRALMASAFETLLPGGGGGGGGGGQTTGGSEVSGAGGGGGGGALHLASLGSISFGTNPGLGSVTAKGGDGGDNSISRDGGLTCGGAGGGGSGGSLWLQTPSTIANATNQGNADISNGAGGTDTGTCIGDGNGGQGSIGVLRIDSAGASLTGSTPTLTHTPAILSGQTYTLTSKAIDTGAAQTQFGAPTEVIDTTTSGCGSTGSVAVTYQASADGVTYGNAVAASDIASLNGNRYLRFNVAITTTGATPPCLTGLTIPYTPMLTDLKLKGGFACLSSANGGNRRGGAPLRNSAGDIALLALAALAAWLPARIRRA